MENLKEKSLNAIIWKLIGDVGAQFASFAVGIVLARIISPAEYGLLAIVVVFTSLSSAIIDGGLNIALIREKNADKNYYDTVATFQLFVSFVLFSLLFFLAPYIAIFYKNDMLILIVRIMSVGFIINGLGLVPNVILAKELHFKKMAIISMPAVIISGTVGIIMAYSNYGIWALVTQSLLANLIRVLFITFKSKFIFNPLNFHLSIFKKLFSFSYKLTLSAIINSLFNNMYPILIGKFYSPIDLGYFSRADSYKNLLSSNITNTLMAVSGPSLATIQDDTERLRRAFVLLTKQAMMINVFVMSLLILVAEPLIIITITEKWLPTVPYLQILCVAAFLYPLHVINLNLLLIKGKSGAFFRLEIIKKTLVVVVILITFKFGMVIFVASSIVISILGYFINSYYTSFLLMRTIGQQIKDVINFILFSIIALSLCFAIKFLFEGLVYNVLIAPFVFVTVYGYLCFVFEKKSVLELKTLILNKFAKK